MKLAFLIQIAFASEKQRFGVEVLSGKSSAKCDPSNPQAEKYPDHYQFFPDFRGNFEAAREKCQSLNDEVGGNWDLVIFNTNQEMFKAREVIINDCWKDEYFRTGILSDATNIFGRKAAWMPKKFEIDRNGLQVTASKKFFTDQIF